MTLHPDVTALLAALPASFHFPPEARHDSAVSRSYIDRMRAASAPPANPEPVRHLTESPVTEHVAVRTYSPAPDGHLPVVVYFHGGGWVLGDLDMHDATCRRIANRAGCAVVNVGYRLAPEHPFPAAHDDATAAIRWAREHAGEFGGDPSTIAVAGSSAGGNLAASMAVAASRSPDLDVALQILIYPVLDSTLDTATYRAYGEGCYLTAEQMAWFWDQYVPGTADRGDPRVSLHHDTGPLEGVAPAIFVNAECDPLRGEAEDYARRLRAAGVSVMETTYPGQIHGFMGMLGVLPDAEVALNGLADLLRGFFAHSSTAGTDALSPAAT